MLRKAVGIRNIASSFSYAQLIDVLNLSKNTDFKISQI